MKRRSRPRRILKWLGLINCGLIVVVWVVSGFWTINLDTPRIYTDFKGGGLEVLVRLEHTESFGFNVKRNQPSRFSHPWYGELPHCIALTDYGLPAHFTYIPLWLPLLLSSFATAIIFYRDRRRPKWCCQNCNYNLTGNASGTCPECGKAA